MNRLTIVWNPVLSHCPQVHAESQEKKRSDTLECENLLKYFNYNLCGLYLLRYLLEFGLCLSWVLMYMKWEVPCIEQIVPCSVSRKSNTSRLSIAICASESCCYCTSYVLWCVSEWFLSPSTFWNHEQIVLWYSLWEPGRAPGGRTHRNVPHYHHPMTGPF